MKIRLWGVRGSIPCPGPHTMKYGGNTISMELRFTDPDRLIIIDAGSGIRELGDFMMRNDLPRGPIDTSIYLSHTHWDHIMGFPFFTPIYLPTTRLKVFGPVSYEGDTLEKIVGGQMTYRYFPVREAELAADIQYIELKEDRFDLGDGISLSTKYLNHPILCLGYRFEQHGKIFCTCYDHEPYQNLFTSDPDDPGYDEAMYEEGEIVAKEQNELIAQFFQGADLLIHDTQYTENEYQNGKLGWGHSSFERAIAAATKAGVKKLVLFHHDPMRTDAQIDQLTEIYCRETELEILFAREGMEFEL